MINKWEIMVYISLGILLMLVWTIKMFYNKTYRLFDYFIPLCGLLIALNGVYMLIKISK